MRFWNFEKQKNSWIELNKSLKDHRLIKLGDEKDSQFSYLILYTFIFSLIHISFNNNFTYLSLISKSILFSFIFFVQFSVSLCLMFCFFCLRFCLARRVYGGWIFVPYDLQILLCILLSWQRWWVLRTGNARRQPTTIHDHR